MATYTILPQKEGYQVDVVADDGSRHSMLGFDTEADALAWVEADKKLATGWPISVPK
jgi:hypothetical protein